MDIQAVIDELTAEINKRIAARDALQKLLSGGAKQPISNRSAAQRRRWAEQKRRQRESAKKGKK